METDILPAELYPYAKDKARRTLSEGSPNWARTSDIMINSHALYRLSYRGTILAMTYLPSKRPASIVGAEGLNFCVRDGNRCDPFAIVTRIFSFFEFASRSLKITQ